MTGLISAVHLADVILIVLAALVLIGLASAASNGLVGLLDWIDARNERRDREDAKVFGELTRREVENAYGPLVMYGPSGEAYDGTVDLPRRGRSA